MRFLREYQRIAHDFHFCNICEDYISPGQEYQGSVYATEKHIIVSKQHSNPLCEFPDEPVEFGSSRGRGKISELRKRVPLKKVA